MRGILCHPYGTNGGGRCYLLGNNLGIDGQTFGNYSEGYSTFTLTNYHYTFDIGIYGYKSIEDLKNANIKITYTSAYGGSKKWNLNYYINNVYYSIGVNEYPFDDKTYSRWLFSDEHVALPTKQNNGIYKFEDLNNKYIKPTYLHLKLP